MLSSELGLSSLRSNNCYFCRLMNPVRILVVEDEGAVGRDIQKTLIRFGYCVGDIARTGSEALEMVLTEGTLRIDKPEGPKELPMLLSRINSEEAKDLIQKIKEDWADNPRNIRKLRGSQSSDLNRGSE